MTSLTAHQRSVLRFIWSYQNLHGLPPTHQEIADGLGFGSTNASACALNRLERKGWITTEHAKFRAIKLLCPTSRSVGPGTFTPIGEPWTIPSISSGAALSLAPSAAAASPSPPTTTPEA